MKLDQSKSVPQNLNLNALFKLEYINPVYFSQE